MPETAVARIRKIVEIAQELRNGKGFKIACLTRIKALCKDPNCSSTVCYLNGTTDQKGEEDGDTINRL